MVQNRVATGETDGMAEGAGVGIEEGAGEMDGMAEGAEVGVKEGAGDTVGGGGATMLKIQY